MPLASEREFGNDSYFLGKSPPSQTFLLFYEKFDVSLFIIVMKISLIQVVIFSFSPKICPS